MTAADPGRTQYKVVVNQEGQFSLWFPHRANTAGWEDSGMAGSKEECLAFIRDVWTDMRPLSLQRAMLGTPARPAVAMA